MKIRETWVITANSSEVRIFLKEGHKLTEIHTLIHPESRMHPRDLVSDAPGRTFNSTSSTRHAVSSPVSVKRQESINFAHEVVNYIEAARKANKIESLYIAASPSFLGLLREYLQPPTLNLVQRELDKDLTQIPIEDIWNHFA